MSSQLCCFGIADKSVDYIISILYLVLQIVTLQEFDCFQFIDIALIVVSLFCQIMCKKKYFGIEQDFSPLFFWILALIRNFMITKLENKISWLLVYVVGFSHGHYSSSIKLQNMNQALFAGKAFSQYSLIFALLITNYNDHLVSTILLLFILLLTIFQNYRKSNQTPEDLQQKKQSNDQSLISRSFNRLLNNDIHNPQMNNTDLKRPTSPSQIELSVIRLDHQISIKPPEQQCNWQNIIEQSEDFICRFTLNLNLIEENIDNAQKNYSLCKFLQDVKLSLIQLLKEIKISNDLNISVQNSIIQEDNKYQKSFYDWIQNTLNQEKIQEVFLSKKQLYPLILNENLNISSPGVQKSVVLMDPFFEKSLSGISEIPLIQGSLEVSNLKNRLTLYGKYQNQKQVSYLYIQISIFQEEIDGEIQNVVALIFRDLDKQVKQIKQNQKNIDKFNTTVKFIQQQASQISQIHKQILQQQNSIYVESSRSRQVTQLVKRTSSLCSYKDSVDDLSDFSEKCPKNQSIQQFINKLQLQFIKITQNNFNYFEVFSENDYGDIYQKKVDITQTINLLFNQFHYDEIVISQKINLILKDIDLHKREISTDTRRLKQLFFNLIDNAIKSYLLDDNNLEQKNVVVEIKNYEDYFHIEIIDNGKGIKESDLGNQRLQQCKLGLAASQKLLRQLGGINKQLTIIRYERLHQTVVKFELPRILIEDKTLCFEDFEFDPIRYIYTS